MRCARDGCERAARFALRICVPAVGWPVSAERHMSAIAGIAVCREHFLEIRAEDWVGPALAKIPGNLRAVFEIMATGALAPDFERAFIRRVALDSPEYLALVRARHGEDGKA